MALWSLGTLKGLMPATQARVDGVMIDWWVLLFAFFVMAASGIIFGLAPALFAARTNLTGTLAGGGGSRGGGRRRNRMLNGLVTVQLAIALMLVNAAILLFVSFLNTTNEPQGFDTENILVVNLEIAGPAYEEAAGRFQFWDRLITRVGSAPGVVAVGATTKLPTRGGTNGSVLVEGETHDLEANRPLVELKLVTSGYFDVMGIDILRGRYFDTGEMIVDPEVTSNFSPGMNGVVIVNQAFVDRYWTEAGTEPIGQVIRADSAEPSWTSTVIGVAEDVRQWSLTYPTLPERYHVFSLQTRSSAFIVLRTERNPGSFISLVREAVHEIDPLIPVDTFFTMKEFVRNRLQGSRVATLLVGLFTIVAVILALSGSWGVMSFRVAQRTQEIGIRIAFGASRRQIVWHFIRQGLKLTGLGGGIGVALTLVLIAVLSANVFGIQPVQRLYLALAFIVLAGLMFLATALPALKATRVDPVEALRSE